MSRTVRRILLFSGAFLLLCISTLVVLAYVYQDDVKNKLVAELNTHLRVPVQQSGIELTLIKRFPEASLRIRDVFVREVRTDSITPDTLLYAKDLYLEFGLFSLLAGDYHVDQLHGEDVRLFTGLDKNGSENWVIWKTDSTQTPGPIDLQLKKVTFDGLVARYRDDRSDLEVRTTSKELMLRGRFRDEGSTLAIAGDMGLVHWTDKNGIELSDRQAEVDLKLAFGGADGAFHIVKGSEVQPTDRSGHSGETPIAVTLDLLRTAKGRTLDLRANGFNLALGDVVALLPENLHKRVRHYDLSGQADVAVHYSGPIEGDGPSLSAGMNVRDGRLKESSSGTVFKAVRGEFAIELTPNGTPRKLTVKDLHAQASSGTIAGNLELNGLKNARVKADLHGDVALADLMRFARIDTLEQVEGRLKVDLRSVGKLRDVAWVKAADLRALTITGTAQLSDASLKMRGVRHRITALNADLAVNGNDAEVRGLRCEVQGNPIEISGTLANLMPYVLFPGQRLSIVAKGRSARLDLASLFSVADEGDDKNAGGAHDYAVKLPELIDLDLRADVDQLVFEDFAATDIHGTIRMKDRVLTVEPIAFNSAQGSVTGDLKLDARAAGGYPLSIEAAVKNMDITQLFHEFRDFGQQFVTQKHLKGRGDVRLVLTATLSPALTLDQNSLHCVADLSIDHGELNDHAPMMAVATYLEKNKLVSPFVDVDELQRRLKHVSFARLENQIEIKDRTVHVPRMLVKSTAMDIEISGTQTFDGGVDDHLNFRLGDLFRIGKPSNDEFGPIADDGTGTRIFLHMHGTTSDLQFSNDGAMASARRKERMKQESAEFNGLLGDMWRGNGKDASTTTNAVITVEDPALGDPAIASTPDIKKKGLGKLLDRSKDADEQEIITVE